MRSIIVTWRLVATTAQDGRGQPLPPPCGAKGMGRVTLNAGGQMMSVVCDGRPALPPGTSRARAEGGRINGSTDPIAMSSSKFGTRRQTTMPGTAVR